MSASKKTSKSKSKSPPKTLPIEIMADIIGRSGRSHFIFNKSLQPIYERTHHEGTIKSFKQMLREVSRYELLDMLELAISERRYKDIKEIFEALLSRFRTNEQLRHYRRNSLLTAIKNKNLRLVKSIPFDYSDDSFVISRAEKYDIDKVIAMCMVKGTPEILDYILSNISPAIVKNIGFDDFGIMSVIEEMDKNKDISKDHLNKIINVFVKRKYITWKYILNYDK